MNSLNLNLVRLNLKLFVDEAHRKTYGADNDRNIDDQHDDPQVITDQLFYESGEAFGGIYGVADVEGIDEKGPWRYMKSMIVEQDNLNIIPSFKCEDAWITFKCLFIMHITMNWVEPGDVRYDDEDEEHYKDYDQHGFHTFLWSLARKHYALYHQRHFINQNHSSFGFNANEDDDAKIDMVDDLHDMDKSVLIKKGIDLYYHENRLIHFVLLDLNYKKLRHLMSYTQVATKVLCNYVIHTANWEKMYQDPTSKIATAHNDFIESPHGLASHLKATRSGIRIRK